MSDDTRGVEAISDEEMNQLRESAKHNPILRRSFARIDAEVLKRRCLEEENAQLRKALDERD